MFSYAVLELEVHGTGIGVTNIYSRIDIDAISFKSYSTTTLDR